MRALYTYTLYMYIYQCYVTDPWKLCDDPVTVVRKEKIPWNPDSQTITVTTNSEAGSEDQVYVYFFDTDGGRKRWCVYLLRHRDTVQDRILQLRLDILPCNTTTRRDKENLDHYLQLHGETSVTLQRSASSGRGAI